MKSVYFFKYIPNRLFDFSKNLISINGWNNLLEWGPLNNGRQINLSIGVTYLIRTNLYHIKRVKFTKYKNSPINLSDTKL